MFNDFHTVLHTGCLGGVRFPQNLEIPPPKKKNFPKNGGRTLLFITDVGVNTLFNYELSTSTQSVYVVCSLLSISCSVLSGESRDLVFTK